jgi:uncharacterized damage-inducible protein DinB
MSATAPPAYTPPVVSSKQQFIDVWTRENATTRRVVAAFADGLGEFTPHERCKTAREVAYIFARSQTRIAAALSNEWQWPPPPFPPMPTSYADVVAAFDRTTDAVKAALWDAPESRMAETITFLTGPKQFGQISVSQLVWFMLMDAIHHRGQLTVYLRAAGAKVPSIYGPTADEPWT